MNVLILTPDAVGSTFLQRLLTIYMQFHQFDKPVINLHELTNGLEKYFSPDFNREIVSKRQVKRWGYYQTLDQIIELLDSVDHYKTSRLANYHIRRRHDPVAQQVSFYRYLNDNFLIIACRRENVFEHAMSWAINAITKKLNVYTPEEKYRAFADIYRNKITLDPQNLIQCLNDYQAYLDWSRDNFDVSNFFCYEQHMPTIEKFILGLPVFTGQTTRIGWNDKFGMDLEDYNRFHCLRADIGQIAMMQTKSLSLVNDTNSLEDDEIVRLYQKHALPSWPAIQDITQYQTLPAEVKTEFQDNMLIPYGVTNQLPRDRREFLVAHVDGYLKSSEAIERMQELDIIVSGPPIKKQTLEEKIFIVKNFDQCLETYNTWADQHASVASPLTQDDINRSIHTENHYWRDYTNRSLAGSDLQTPSRLGYQSDAHLSRNQSD